MSEPFTGKYAFLLQWFVVSFDNQYQSLALKTVVYFYENSSSVFRKLGWIHNDPAHMHNEKESQTGQHNTQIRSWN